MKIHDIFESTVAGSIASVAMPLGSTQKRNKPEKAPKVAKGKKYANTISEGKMKDLAYDLQHLDAGNFIKKYGKSKEEMKASLKEAKISEAELQEDDLILVPGQLKGKDKSFIPHEKDRRDHEVEMARGEVYAAAKDAMRIFKLLKDRSEDEGIMGWQQSYITLASDYLNSVADSLEYQGVKSEGGVIAGGMSNFEEGRYYNPLDQERREQDAMDADRRRFKWDELSQELKGEEEAARRANEGPWYILINGKLVRDKSKNPYTFNTLSAAQKAVKTMSEKEWNKDKKFVYTRTPKDSDVSEGEIVSEFSESAADKIRARIGTSGMLQNMMRRHEDYMDALNQKALSRMSDEERYNAAKTQHEIDVLAHKLERMKKDDDDWKKTFDMLRDRINRYQWTTQQDVDPEKLEKISNIKYQPTKEGMERAVDSKGRTQQDWIKAVKQKYPDAKIIQSKMIDGPVHAVLPDGKKASWTKGGSDDIAEGKKHKCPECGGELVSEELMNEKKDACYYKVKSRYKVWPSAYASGALVKCRKKGASNWGNKSK